MEKGEAPQDQLFEVDQIIIAAGQEPFEDLSSRFNGKGMPIHVIGGARETSGLDAKVAIREGAELAARLCPDVGLFPLWQVEVGDGSFVCLGGQSEGFRKCGMRMNGGTDIGGVCPHLNG